MKTDGETDEAENRNLNTEYRKTGKPENNGAKEEWKHWDF